MINRREALSRFVGMPGMFGVGVMVDHVVADPTDTKASVVMLRATRGSFASHQVERIRDAWASAVQGSVLEGAKVAILNGDLALEAVAGNLSVEPVDVTPGPLRDVLPELRRASADGRVVKLALSRDVETVEPAPGDEYVTHCLGKRRTVVISYVDD
ncbi:MAG: hypothetical protein AB7Q16_24115 [Vicinamibacterales bacterium]